MAETIDVGEKRKLFCWHQAVNSSVGFQNASRNFPMLGYGIYGNLWESTLQLDPNTTFNTTKPWNVWNFHGNFHIFLGPFREMGVDDPAMCCISGAVSASGWLVYSAAGKASKLLCNSQTFGNVFPQKLDRTIIIALYFEDTFHTNCRYGPYSEKYQSFWSPKSTKTQHKTTIFHGKMDESCQTVPQSTKFHSPPLVQGPRHLGANPQQIWINLETLSLCPCASITQKKIWKRIAHTFCQPLLVSEYLPSAYCPLQISRGKCQDVPVEAWDFELAAWFFAMLPSSTWWRKMSPNHMVS